MKVLDVSAKPRLKDSKYWSAPVDQLYHPTGEFGSDSQNIVYVTGELLVTKFYPILLKEWGWLVKENGYLVIDYSPTELCNAQKLEQAMWWVWKNSFELVSHEVPPPKTRKLQSTKQLLNYLHSPERIITSNVFNSTRKDVVRCIYQKKVSTKIIGDSITKWTFGIITNGRRLDWVEQMIASIKAQRISEYEIIICGTYLDKKKKDIKVIPFSERNDRGWITKKKNLIISEAKYENICLLHDRIVLDKNWYRGMRKWGNTFEILGCQQLYEGERVNDWVAQHNFIYKDDKEYFSLASYADYKDWYKTTWLLGQFYVLKKTIPVRLNETIYYGQSEDYLFSKELQERGFLVRLNPFASVSTLTHKYLNPSLIKYDEIKEIPSMQLNSTTAVIKFMTFLFLRSCSYVYIYPSPNFLSNISGSVYRFLLSFSPQKSKDSQESAKVSG